MSANFELHHDTDIRDQDQRAYTYWQQRYDSYVALCPPTYKPMPFYEWYNTQLLIEKWF